MCGYEVCYVAILGREAEDMRVVMWQFLGREAEYKVGWYVEVLSWGG